MTEMDWYLIGVIVLGLVVFGWQGLEYRRDRAFHKRLNKQAQEELQRKLDEMAAQGQR